MYDLLAMRDGAKILISKLERPDFDHFFFLSDSSGHLRFDRYQQMHDQLPVDVLTLLNLSRWMVRLLF